MGTIKIGQFGDSHIGFKQYRLQERKDDFKSALQKAINIFKQQKVDVIIATGDIFNHARPEASDFLDVYNIVNNCNIPIVSIDGNHDSSSNIWQILCGMIPVHKVVKPIITASGVKINIGGLNYTNKLYLENELGEFIHNNKDCIDILLLHQGLNEWVPHEAAGEISALALANIIEPAGIRCVCLGHIHKQQVLTYNNISFISAGSTELWSMDEEPKKTVTIITYDTDTKDHIIDTLPIPTREFDYYCINTLEDLEKVEKIDNLGRLYIVSYDKNILDIKKRLISKFSTGFLYRLLPISEEIEGIQYTKNDTTDIVSIQQIIKTTYKEDTDEYNIITALLQEPHRITEIVCTYLETKGVICKQ